MKFLLVLAFCQPAPAIDSPPLDLSVVAFLGVECPLARLAGQRLNELQTEFPHVDFRAFAPNLHDSDEAVAKFQSVLNFPVRKSKAEAIQLGATHSPEVFLIHDGRVVYRGRIDDQYAPGQHRRAATRRDLAVAIQEVLAGRPVSVPWTEPAGCHLNLGTPPVSQATDALDILHAKCASCHHPQTAAPFSLLTYQDARAWHATIRDVVTQGRMPPWGADSGEFANDRRLTVQERRTLLAWLDAGCPDGDHRVPPAFACGWSFEPDLVQKARPFEVPATGVVDYQEFRFPIFSTDTWVAAIEMRGSRAVHHINALVEPADAVPGRRYEFGDDHYLATMVAGNPGIQLPDGTAKLIPANSRIKLEVHYEPIGQPVLDQSEIALKIVPRPRKQVITQMLLKQDILLPPHALATFHNDWRLEKDYTLLAIFPHMHLRGKSMRVEARIPGQKPEVLLNVPRYDYAWQDRYVLSRPRQLPAGTVIHVTAEWDNTAANPLNPDPSQTVRAGKQAVDEMFQCSLDVYETNDPVRPTTLWLSVAVIVFTPFYFGMQRRRMPGAIS
jgi:hypothetical protein